MQAIVILLASLLIGTVAALGNYTYAEAQETAEEKKCTDTGDYLDSFNCGRVTQKNGTTVREFTLITKETHQVPITSANNSMDRVIFPGWTYNGTIPAPTLRMTEDDTVYITVINSPNSKHHHSLHMHSVHDPAMDGTFGPSGDIAPGKRFTYKFTAGPAGVYPYHCHVEPVQDHINRGLYGAMIIDPKVPRTQAHEMMMLMNGYDLDLNKEMIPTARVPTVAEANQIMYPKVSVSEEEGAAAEGDEGEASTGEEGAASTRPELELERDNEIYTVNGKAFEYMDHPIKLKLGEPVRLYLVNMVEFDPVNSFHLHAGMFNYTASGTEGTAPIVTDIVTLGQGDRGIIEFTPTHKGMMMIHAHVNEFTSLGWMGAFEVVS